MLLISKRQIIIIWKWYNILHKEELVEETYLPCSTVIFEEKKLEETFSIYP
jgi:hypothetical protein